MVNIIREGIIFIFKKNLKKQIYIYIKMYLSKIKMKKNNEIGITNDKRRIFI